MGLKEWSRKTKKSTKQIRKYGKQRNLSDKRVGINEKAEFVVDENKVENGRKEETGVGVESCS